MQQQFRYLTRNKLDLTDISLSDIIKRNTSEQLQEEMATTAEVERLLQQYSRNKHSLSDLEPRSFSGSTQDNAANWIQKLENYCKYNHIKDNEKLILFESLLQSGASCWYSNLDATTKKDWTAVKNKFSECYAGANRWINSQKIENRKLSPTETCDNYVKNMTDMAQLAGMGEDELSKALIRGLPEEMKWMVVSFNPKTIGETIARILLSEASYKHKKAEVYSLEERISSHKLTDCLEKLSLRLDEMERRSQNNDGADRRQRITQWRPLTYRRCRTCGKDNHAEANCYFKDVRQNTTYRGNYNQNRFQDREQRFQNRRQGGFQSNPSYQQKN